MGVRLEWPWSLFPNLDFITITQVGCPYDHVHHQKFDSMSIYPWFFDSSNRFWEKKFAQRAKKFALRAKALFFLLKRYLWFFSKTVFGFNPYSKALCNILDGEQAYNLLFNFVELARTNIQRVDPICESLCLPPPQLSFDEYWNFYGKLFQKPEKCN